MSTDSTKPAGLFRAVIAPFSAFLKLEAAGGIVLLASAVLALVWANVHAASYQAVFGLTVSFTSAEHAVHFTVREFINDGLMTIFFLVVGMEIKRELVSGALNSVARALLPAAAAVGGMVVPAVIFVAFTAGGPNVGGWGIPMATDIAFCVGVLALLKSRVPHALVVFVTALAIFDDIGGILVIALFYGASLLAPWLAAAAGLVLVLVVLNRRHVVDGAAYAAVGAGLWYALHHGGIHATLSGVMLGLAVPASPKRPSRVVLTELSAYLAELDRKPPDEDLDGAEVLAIEEKLESVEAPLRRFVHLWHPWVAFVIMPLFALANAGVALEGFSASALLAPVALGSALGLFVGKQLGVFTVTAVVVRLGWAPMPGGASYAKLFGVSVVAGIGFTVALFIATLAYSDVAVLEQAKLGVLVGSLAAGLVGAALLRLTSRLPLVPPQVGR